MNELMKRGADIIIKQWVRLRPWENLLIVSSEKYAHEVSALKDRALEVTKRVEVLTLDPLAMHVGAYFDDKEDAFMTYDAVIGATEYSLITTKSVKKAISNGKRFLSLPLSTSNGVSMLEYDFLQMDTRKSRIMADVMMDHLVSSHKVRVTTDLGTDLTFNMENRRAGFFNGCCRDGNGLSSASVEVYIPIVEDATDGVLVLDGSMGYIGTVTEPVHIYLENGKIVEIESNPSGEKLKEFISKFSDHEEMVVAAELGIGLNTYSRCAGNCYIEDESAYGTFHIGFGRNIALGGVHEATGHYDLVTHKPTIYVDNREIMKDGLIFVLEPLIYS